MAKSNSKHKLTPPILHPELKNNLIHIIDKIEDHVIILDKEWKILYINPIVEKYFRAKRRKLIGQNIWEKVPFLVGHTFYKECLIASSKQENRRFQVYSSVYHEWFSGAIFPFKGGLTSYLINIDKQKTIEKEREKAITFLKSVVNQMPVGVVVAEAPEGKIIMRNRELKKIFKFPLKKTSRIEDYKTLDAYHLESGLPYLPEEWPLTRSLLKGEVVRQEEIKIIKGDSSVGYIRIRSTPIKDNKGNIIAGVAIDEDITKSKILSDKLYERKMEYEALSNNSPDIIVRYDRNFRHLYISPAVKKSSGFPPKHYIGKNFTELDMPKDIINYWEQNIKKVFETGKPATIEYRFPDPKGYRDFQSQLVPEFDRDKKVKSVLSVSRDITDMKEIERKKDEFISMASHELKTPVTTIKVFSQILRKSATKSDYNNIPIYLKKMEDQIDKLNTLVDGLLNVSRIQTGTFPLDKHYFSLNKLIKEVTFTINTTNPSHKITVEDIDKIIVYGDKNRISEVVVNLLLNAIKYSPGVPEIKVDIQKNNNQAVVNVTDYGIGIEKEYRDKIFQRLYRVYDKNEKTFPGLGIGLYIASEIIKLHKGKLSVESKLGEGSIFSFTLPLIKKSAH